MSAPTPREGCAVDREGSQRAQVPENTPLWKDGRVDRRTSLHRGCSGSPYGTLFDFNPPTPPNLEISATYRTRTLHQPSLDPPQESRGAGR